MPDPANRANRTPPEHVNRVTRRGADQYVLACNVRREAGDVAFSNIEHLEKEVHERRAAVKWKREHASTFTEKWVQRRVLILVCVLAGMGTLAGWTFTPNGKLFRIIFMNNYFGPIGGPPPNYWRERHPLTADISQHEIDSLTAVAASLDTASAK